MICNFCLTLHLPIRPPAWWQLHKARTWWSKCTYYMFSSTFTAMSEEPKPKCKKYLPNKIFSRPLSNEVVNTRPILRLWIWLWKRVFLSVIYSCRDWNKKLTIPGGEAVQGHAAWWADANDGFASVKLPVKGKRIQPLTCMTFLVTDSSTNLYR